MSATGKVQLRLLCHSVYWMACFAFHSPTHTQAGGPFSVVALQIPTTLSPKLKSATRAVVSGSFLLHGIPWQLFIPWTLHISWKYLRLGRIATAHEQNWTTFALSEREEVHYIAQHTAASACRTALFIAARSRPQEQKLV